MLLVMRCTHPNDKAMALGIIQSAIGLFGNVPCPLYMVPLRLGVSNMEAVLPPANVSGIHNGLVVWSKAHRIDINAEDGNETLASRQPLRLSAKSQWLRRTQAFEGKSIHT
ncbi:unnamed protein product [Ceratitis capitata]|uniref:(Mediterranean fruit fly) hypothetical protein n=1 Tax=Ceratitis capitata TaxID=7213 RepID=A0A811V2S5_CERCA|nr:unnamed protein product [Ceratitis capitata]